MNSYPTYYCRFPSGEIRGPLHDRAIKREIQRGEFPDDFMVSRDAKTCWVAYSEFLEKGDEVLPEVKTLATTPLPRVAPVAQQRVAKSPPPTVPFLTTFFQTAAVIAIFVGLVCATAGAAQGNSTVMIAGLSLIFGAAPVLWWMGAIITLLDRIARNGEGES